MTMSVCLEIPSENSGSLFHKLLISRPVLRCPAPATAGLLRGAENTERGMMSLKDLVNCQAVEHLTISARIHRLCRLGRAQCMNAKDISSSALSETFLLRESLVSQQELLRAPRMASRRPPFRGGFDIQPSFLRCTTPHPFVGALHLPAGKQQS
jgi:hypothetical protein